jgi:pyruvate formate lyase activating enzyme
MRDRLYYIKSGGGITFSGGEPLLHVDDICELSAMINRSEASILIETCGHVSLDHVKKAAFCADIFFYDFKHIDSGAHKRLTGFGNEQIIENLKWLDKASDVEISIRYPYIPGYNDDIRDVRLFLKFVSELKRVKDVWFLPYHRLGAVKYQGLVRSYPLEEVKPLRVKDVEFLKEFCEVYGLDIHVA